MLVIRAPALTTRIVGVDNAERGQVLFDRWQKPQSCIIDADNDLDDLLDKRVSIVFLTREEVQDSHFFALVLVNAGSGTFKRLGCLREVVDPCDTSASDIEAAPMETCHIV